MATKKKSTGDNPLHESTMSPFQHVAHLVRSGADTKAIQSYARAMARAAIDVDVEVGYVSEFHNDAIAAIWVLTVALGRLEAENATLRKRLSRAPKPAAKKPAGELMKKNGSAYPSQNGVSAPPSVFTTPSE